MDRTSVCKVGAVGLALLLQIGASAPVSAELLSKRYEFRRDVVLEIGAPTSDGLRLDSVRFLLPSRVKGGLLRAGGLVRAEVALSNTTSGPLKAGVAVALFDDEGRLLGVANGGSRLASIKSGRQKTFEIVFDGVNAEAHRATTFQISVETKH